MALALALLGTVGCVPSEGLTRCSSGIVCPQGKVCTDDGAECIEEDARCGDGIVQAALGEDCDCGDPENLSPECLAPNSESAAAECRTDCILHCGDGEINEPEQCEGSPENRSCIGLGFDAGTTSCTACMLDVDECRRIGVPPLIAPESFDIRDTWGDGNGTFFGTTCAPFPTCDESTVVAYDGARWRSWDLGTELRAVWGFASDDVFVGGKNQIWHFDGETWELSASIEGTVLEMHGLERTNLWAVGDSDPESDSPAWAWRFNGTSWIPQPNEGPLGGRTVAARSTGQIYVVSSVTPSLWVFDGEWTQGSPVTDVQNLWRTPSDQVLGVSNNEVTDVTDPGCFDLSVPQDDCPIVLEALSNEGKMFSNTLGEMFVAGNRRFYYFDGGGWTQSDLDVGSVAASIWADDSGTIFAAGGVNAPLSNFDGQSSFTRGWFWADLIESQDTVQSLWATPDGELYLASPNGVFRRGGGSLVNTGLTDNVREIVGSGSDNILALTDSGVQRYDGSSWSAFPEPVPAQDRAWTASADEAIFALGPCVRIWDGLELGSCETMGDPSANVTHVWGSTATGYFAISTGQGSERAVYHRSPEGEWIEGPPARGIGGPPEGPAYAVGSGGTIHRFDGGTWTQIPTTTSTDLTQVHASGPNDVLAVGSGRLALRFDGSVWSPLLLRDDSGEAYRAFVTRNSIYLLRESGVRVLHKRGSQ